MLGYDATMLIRAQRLPNAPTHVQDMAAFSIQLDARLMVSIGDEHENTANIERLACSVQTLTIYSVHVASPLVLLHHLVIYQTSPEI